MPVLDDLREERAGLINDIEALTGTKDFDPKDTHYVEARSKAEALDSKIKSIVEWQSSRDSANQIDALAVRHNKNVEQRSIEAALSPGEIFTRSAAFTEYRGHGTSSIINVPLEQMIQQRAPLLTTTFAGAIPPERIEPSAPPAQQTPLLSVIDRIPVTSNSVEWVFYPAAAPLAGVVAEGAAKPEAAVAPVLKTVTLETIAHWLNVSRQFNEDAGALRQYIDGALRRGVRDKMEAQAAAVLVADATIPVVTNTTGTLLGGIRKAIGVVQAAGYRPQYVLLNPMDYAALDIDLLGRTLNGPNTYTQFWGVAPVPVGALASGTAYVGDWTTAMAWLARTDVAMYQTDSHASNFISNLITLLAEARGKAIVHRPEAAAKVAGTVVGTLGVGGQSAESQTAESESKSAAAKK